MNRPRRIYESEIEDYLEEHPEALFDYGIDAYQPNPVVLGRQVSLCHGIADLLVWCNRLYVIELKARRLRAKDVCQVLRYTHDVEVLMLSMGNDLFRSPELERIRAQFRGYALDKFDESFMLNFTFKVDAYYPSVCPVLIGRSAPEEVCAAMDSIHGETFMWEPDVVGFGFAQLLAERSPTEPASHELPAWMKRAREAAIASAIDDAQVAERTVVKALFGKEAEIKHG